MSSRSIRVVRVCLLVAIVAWFFSPPDWRYAIPLWLPFVVALVLEIEFAVGGFRQRGRTVARERGRGPQRVDLEQFGWDGEEPDDEDPEFWRSRPVPRRRATFVRRLAISLAVLGFVALAAWAINGRRGWSALDHRTQAQVEHVLSGEASRIAGHPAAVHCDTAGRHVGAVQEADGLAEVGGRNAWLTPAICYQLYRVLDKHDTHSFSPTGRALAVLAHESWHLHGVSSEALANCYGFQSGVTIGIRLGLPASHARAVMREQLADNASDAASTPAYLVPHGCSNGGQYDLHPASPEFP